MGLVLALPALSACSGSRAPEGASQPGAYPIAVAPSALSETPVASSTHYALVAAGNPVRVELPGAAAITLNVTGPQVTLPSGGGPAEHAPGILTVTASSPSGPQTVSAAGFLGLDEHQRRFALTADHDAVTARPGAPAQLHLRADFKAGHTTLTYQPQGKPLVTWDFVIELD